LFKRVLDLVVAVPVCVLLAPVFLVTALAVKLDSRGPVFFAQKRWGRGRVPFTMLKFRSLRHRARDPHERYEMQEADDRITRVGAFIRRTSLDELPQLFNVLGGAMSLVGPRPLVDWESRESAETHADRFRVKPGITGWSQITVRNAADFVGRLDKDVEYVRRWSPMLDVAILLRTPWVVLSGKGIYPEATEEPRA
jgi:undecaprenyl-phosphate glucose phosphotransferase